MEAASRLSSKRSLGRDQAANEEEARRIDGVNRAYEEREARTERHERGSKAVTFAEALVEERVYERYLVSSKLEKSLRDLESLCDPANAALQEKINEQTRLTSEKSRRLLDDHEFSPLSPRELAAAKTEIVQQHIHAVQDLLSELYGHDITLACLNGQILVNAHRDRKQAEEQADEQAEEQADEDSSPPPTQQQPGTSTSANQAQQVQLSRTREEDRPSNSAELQQMMREARWGTDEDRLYEEQQEEVRSPRKEEVSFEEALQEDAPYPDFERDLGDVEEASRAPLTHLESHFNRMSVCQESARPFLCRKLLKNLCFHPSRRLLVASSAAARIALWTPPNSEIYFLEGGNKEVINGLRFNPFRPNEIVSSSRDGVVCGDLGAEVFRKVFDSEGNSCNCFDTASEHELLVGQCRGRVAMVDTRATHRGTQWTHQCHHSQVTTVGIHPCDRHHFVSADFQGTVRLWDVRHLSAPLQEINKEPEEHRKERGIAFRASLSPLTGKHLLTSCNGTVRIYNNNADLGEKFHLNQKLSVEGERYGLNFSRWLPNGDDAFAVGSRQNGAVHVFRPSAPVPVRQFTFQYEFSVTDAAFHPALPVMGGITNRTGIFLFSEGG